MHKPNLANNLILRKLISDKKRRQSLEESLEISCNKYFCSFCLKNYYDTNFNSVKNDPNWCCPHCTGNCFCRFLFACQNVIGFALRILLFAFDLLYTLNCFRSFAFG